MPAVVLKRYRNSIGYIYGVYQVGFASQRPEIRARVSGTGFLVGDGLIYLDTAGQGSGTDNWRWRLSEVGQRVAKGGIWEPRDPDGYLVRLWDERTMKERGS